MVTSRDGSRALGARRDDVEADQEPEACDEQNDSPTLREVAPEVGAHGEEAGSDRHEPHRLAEERARLVTRDSRLKRRVDGAHESERTPSRTGIKVGPACARITALRPG